MNKLKSRRIFWLLLILTISIVIFLAISNQIAEKKSKTDLNLRLESFALSLTPSKLSDTQSRKIATMLHLGLIRVSSDNTVQPGIAKSWQRDGNIWRFELSDSLTFNDNSPITTEDVIGSLCQSMQPSSLFGWSLRSIKHQVSGGGNKVECDGIRAIGKSILIEETSPAPWLLDALAGPAGWVVKKSATPGAYGNVPGAGAYRLGEVKPDSTVELLATQNSVLPAGFQRVVFHLITDDNKAISSFNGGDLDILEATSPSLIKILKENVSANYSIVSQSTEKLRVLIVGEKQLIKKGFNIEQVSAFKSMLNREIDRNTLYQSTGGMLLPNELPFIIKDFKIDANERKFQSTQDFPVKNLIIITESDQFSDFIASKLPKKIQNINIDYRGVDKGILIGNLVKGDFDLASIMIEASVKSPVFWHSFFNPNSPFSAFGKPISSLEKTNIFSEREVFDDLKKIIGDGNWIGLAREESVVGVSKRITGLRFTPAGQLSFEALSLQK